MEATRCGARTLSLRASLIAGMALLVPFSSAQAQDSQPQGKSAQPSATSGNPDQSTGDIVVTATRRSQSVLNVPLAIDALQGSTLTQYKVSSVQDLAKINPSLNVVSLGATQQQIVIRGISSNVGATTGVYLDEAPLVGPFNGNTAGDGTPSLRLHDVDHVEVLKGPQGTLFGAGSMDGTLRVITNKPRLDRIGGAIDASGSEIQGGNGFFDGSATVNLPIVKDRLGIRVTGWTEVGGGYVDKRYLTGINDRNSNDVHLYGGRFLLRWRPVDALTIDLGANVQSIKVDGPQYVTAGVNFLPTPTDGGRYLSADPVMERYRENYQLYSAVADYDVGVGDIVASGSYGRKKVYDAIDTSGLACFFGLCPGTPAYPSAFTTDMPYKDYTAELRFSSHFNGPLQIVAGAYYQEDHRSFNGSVMVADPATGRIPCDTYLECASAGLLQPGFGNSPVIFANTDQFDTRQYAIYGQIDYKILRNLTATVGARYFSAHLTDQPTDQQDVYPDFIFGIITVPSAGAKTTAHQSKPTFNFSLMWKPRDNISIYARAASGFRIGGINNDASVAGQGGVVIPTSFEPDSLWDYEIGAKFDLLDRALSFDMSAYHIDWNNQQTNALAAGTFNYQLNTGLTRTNGVEASLTARPIQGFSLAGSVTYVDAKLESDLPPDVVNGGTPGLKGDRMPYVPHWSFSGRADYEAPISSAVAGYIQGDFSYRGSSYTQFRPVTAEQIAAGIPDNYYTKVPDYFLVNARVGIRTQGVDFSFFVQNLTNKFAVLGVKADGNSTRLYTARPRSFGISVSTKF